MKKSKLMAFLLILGLFLIGCSQNTATNENQETPEPNESGEQNTKIEEPNGEDAFDITYTHPFDLEGEIDFWTWDPMFEDVIVEFNKTYPNIKVNLSVMELGELHDNLQTTLTAGRGAPDVSHMEQGNFTRFQSEGLLEDLFKPEYNIQRYYDLQPEYNWHRWKSWDGKRQLGIPWDLTIFVWYYREDLYEQVGLPTDPEELGEFLQDTDNVLYAARVLAANNMYMYEWRDSPAIQYGDGIGYFDRELNYLRNNERMAELLDIVKQGVQIGWAPQISVLFSDEGKQLTQQGRVASFPAGTNGARHLREVIPEQSGKWRVTKLPLGVHAAAGGSTFVLTSQSDNKEAAWAFMEFINFDEEAWKIYTEHAVQPGWKHITVLDWYQNHTDEYLGGQKDYAFYETLVDTLPIRTVNPLEGAAWGIYIDKVNESIDNNIDSRTTLQQIEDITMRQLAPEIEQLKKEAGLE